MRLMKTWMWAGAVAASMWALPALTDDGGVPPPNPGDTLEQPEPPKPPVPPERPTRPEFPVEVQKLMQEFRELRQVQAAEFKALGAQMRAAKGDERQQLRDQLRELAGEQREARQVLREQIRERIKELTQTLPNRKDVLNAAKDQAGENKTRNKGE